MMEKTAHAYEASRRHAAAINPLIDDLTCNTLERACQLINLIEEHAMAKHDCVTDPESVVICLQVVRHALEYESYNYCDGDFLRKG
jgi:hypothetical protein